MFTLKACLPDKACVLMRTSSVFSFDEDGKAASSLSKRTGAGAEAGNLMVTS